jgi:hypothetical protein
MTLIAGAGQGCMGSLTAPKLDAAVKPGEEGQSKALITVASMAVVMVLSGSAVNFLAAIVYSLRSDTTTGVAELSGDIWLSCARTPSHPPLSARQLCIMTLPSLVRRTGTC